MIFEMSKENPFPLTKEEIKKYFPNLELYNVFEGDTCHKNKKNPLDEVILFYLFLSIYCGAPSYTLSKV